MEMEVDVLRKHELKAFVKTLDSHHPVYARALYGTLAFKMI